MIWYAGIGNWGVMDDGEERRDGRSDILKLTK